MSIKYLTWDLLYAANSLLFHSVAYTTTFFFLFYWFALCLNYMSGNLAVAIVFYSSILFEKWHYPIKVFTCFPQTSCNWKLSGWHIFIGMFLADNSEVNNDKAVLEMVKNDLPICCQAIYFWYYFGNLFLVLSDSGTIAGLIQITISRQNLRHNASKKLLSTHFLKTEKKNSESIWGT